MRQDISMRYRTSRQFVLANPADNQIRQRQCQGLLLSVLQKNATLASVPNFFDAVYALKHVKHVEISEDI